MPVTGKCFLCGATCKRRCPKCRAVFYCSREHYMAHHQKEYCFPYRLGSNCFFPVAYTNLVSTVPNKKGKWGK